MEGQERHALAYVGALRYERRAGQRGRGWVAAETIHAGSILMVEPALLHAPASPQGGGGGGGDGGGGGGGDGSGAASTIPLFEVVASTLSRGGPAAEELFDVMRCMHPPYGVGVGDDSEEDRPPLDTRERA